VGKGLTISQQVLHRI